MLVQARLQNQQLRDQARELYRLRDAVTQLRAQLQPASAPPNALNLRNAPRELQESADRLRELQYEHFVAAGQKPSPYSHCPTSPIRKRPPISTRSTF